MPTDESLKHSMPTAGAGSTVTSTSAASTVRITSIARTGSSS
jgi:hypothetical protein